MDTQERDVFLCHAGEDKDLIARPLYALMNQEAASGMVRVLPLIAGSD